MADGLLGGAAAATPVTIVMGSVEVPAEVATPNTTARIWASGRWLAPVRQTQTGNCRHKRSAASASDVHGDVSRMHGTKKLLVRLRSSIVLMFRVLYIYSGSLWGAWEPTKRTGRSKAHTDIAGSAAERESRVG